MDKYTKELFELINEAIDKFKFKYPNLDKTQIAFNAVSMFSSTLVNLVTEGATLDQKFKLLDDLIQKEKEWIEHEYNKEAN